MNNTIVMNTLSGAVTEYDNFAFQSVTPTHAGSVNGLYRFGGDTDDGAHIIATIITGKKLIADSRKKYLDMAYLSIKGSGTGTFKVYGEATSYDYPVLVRESGESRAKPGRGIRENYLAFGYVNSDGTDFELDRMEVAVESSTTRRV